MDQTDRQRQRTNPDYFYFTISTTCLRDKTEYISDPFWEAASCEIS